MRLGAILAAGLILSAGCGPTSPPSAGAPPSPSLSPSQGPAVDANLNVVVGSLFGRGGELHCPNWIEHVDNIVLAQSRLTYSDAEISRMAAAFSGEAVIPQQLDPSLLAVMPGAMTSSVPSHPDLLFLEACLVTLEITNGGTNTVQIPRVGLRLLEKPIANQTVYRLVEFCSVVHSSDYCGPRGFGGGADCSTYNVYLSLADQPAGADFLARPMQTDLGTMEPCPEVTLAAGQSVTFRLAVYSTSALVYRAGLVLDVVTSTGRGTIAFPQMAGVFTYADPSQFLCYRLSGSTFVLWHQGASAYDFVGNSQAGGYCP